jgi:hypothetical protein
MRRIPKYLLKQTITIQLYQGSTAYGETFGLPIEKRGLLLPKRRLVKRADGSEVVTSATLYLAPDPSLSIAAQSKVTYDGNAYTVESAEPFIDSYIELLLSPSTP